LRYFVGQRDREQATELEERNFALLDHLGDLGVERLLLHVLDLVDHILRDVGLS